MYLARIEEVKDLHHDKCIEDESKMSRDNICSLFDALIIIIPHYRY